MTCNYYYYFLCVENPVEITSAYQAALKSPLADEIFKIDGINSILLASDYLTITKRNDINWPQLNPQIYAAIMDFFTTGQEVYIAKKEDDTTTTTEFSSSNSDPKTVEIEKMITEILDARIRPTIQDDGGDVEFRGFNLETGWVQVKLVGACRTCSSSTITLRNGIEAMLMYYIPEVKGVEQVTDPEEEQSQKEFEKFEVDLIKLKNKKIE